MTKKILTAVVLSLSITAGLVASCPCGAQPPSVSAAKKVAGALQPFIDRHTLAGAVTLVATRDKVLSLEAIGYADVAGHRPMRTDNLFWIASMTKPMTATALMMLVEEGKVSIDDPVEKYLPEFKGQMLSFGPDPKHPQLKKPAHPVTVKHLLTHTGGLAIAPAPGGHWDAVPLGEAVKGFAKTPLKFEPGSKYEYCNPGINTLGRIIEVAGGLPYEEFMAKRLFRPLGMKDTTFWPTEEQVRRLAKSYKPTADKKGLEETAIGTFSYPLSNRKRTALPAGGLFSTANDVGVFCRMVLCGGVWEGKRYLSAKAVQEMSSLHTAKPFPPRGLGWATSATPNGPFGHGGAYKTYMQIDPERQLITVLMVQHAVWGEGGQKILPAFQQAALAAFGAVPAK